MTLIVQKLVQILITIVKVHRHLSLEGIVQEKHTINHKHLSSTHICYSYSSKRINNKMKPCLVQKTSTSDEELQLNETNNMTTSSAYAGRSNEQPTHGILKVPSGKEIILFVDMLFSDLSMFFCRFNKSRTTSTESTSKTCENKK